MTGNAISNLCKAVEVYTRQPTNMTHYQVFIAIFGCSHQYNCNHHYHSWLQSSFEIVTITFIFGLTDDTFLAGYQEVGVDKQLHPTFQPHLSSVKPFLRAFSSASSMIFCFSLNVLELDDNLLGSFSQAHHYHKCNDQSSPYFVSLSLQTLRRM